MSELTTNYSQQTNQKLGSPHTCARATGERTCYKNPAWSKKYSKADA